MTTAGKPAEPHLMTGRQYRESLRDGRQVFLGGEKIKDVAEHPYYVRSIDILAGLFDAQFDPATRDITTYVDEGTGERYSTSWLVPQNKEDLRRRRRLLSFTTDQTLGVFGRPPDYGPTLAIGFLAAMHKIEKTEPEAPEKISNFIAFGRDNNLMSTDLIADAQADRTLPAAQNPGRLRAIEERQDGLVVYGSKPVASAATQGHWGGIATLLSPNMDPNATMWAYVPVNAPGLKFVAREPVTSIDVDPEDHPIDSRGEEIDAFAIFDHVFIPWSHVFSFRNEQTLPLYLDVGVFPQWAILARMAQRGDILAATTQLIVESLGTVGIPAVRAAVADVVLYAATLRAFVLASEEQAALTPHGVCVPDVAMVTAGRLYATTNLPGVMQVVRELCGQGLVSRFTKADLDREDIGRLIDEFMPGHDMTGREKNHLMNFVWDLTCSSHATRLLLFEIVNSTPPAAIRQQLYQSYDRRQTMQRVRDYIGLPGGQP